MDFERVDLKTGEKTVAHTLKSAGIVDNFEIDPATDTLYAVASFPTCVVSLDLKTGKEEFVMKPHNMHAASSLYAMGDSMYVAGLGGLVRYGLADLGTKAPEVVHWITDTGAHPFAFAYLTSAGDGKLIAVGPGHQPVGAKCSVWRSARVWYRAVPPVARQRPSLVAGTDSASSPSPGTVLGG